ncbi:MAG TPA: D-aminoacylase [Gemmatimonadales bacterium]|nr:D-aminoacylase [Gemmatimonadales bacterium]
MTISRRTFATATALGLAGLIRAPAVLARRRYGLVIRGGLLVDGTGAPGRLADIAIDGGRIVSIADRLADRGDREIDARGMVVAPGFIDIHSHGDGSVRSDPRVESVVRQGVTTMVVGADGDSATDLEKFFASIDALRPGANVASMVGLGMVRGEVVGAMDQQATPAQIEAMTARVRAALAAGACGASTGLEYTPGGFADTAELIALCRPLAGTGLCYATHMRNEDDRVLEAIDEAIAVARGAGCGLQISHLKMQGPRNWPKLDRAFARIEAVRDAGLDIAFDRYPYVAYSTGLASIFPIWSRNGGITALLRRVDDPIEGPRVKAAVLAKLELIGGWDNIQVTSVREQADRGLEGQRLGTHAAAQGADPYDYTVGLFRRNGGGIGMVGFAMSEANLDRIYAHPLSMVCSDGGAFAVDGPTRRGTPHPRGAGTFPRMLGRYVRARHALTLEQAVHKMSGYPAARCGIADRGRLATGLAADVVVFDAETVADRATFADPYQYPVGIGAVVVNGEIALDERGERGPGSGRSVRVNG